MGGGQPLDGGVPPSPPIVDYPEDSNPSETLNQDSNRLRSGLCLTRTITAYPVGQSPNLTKHNLRILYM